MSLDPLREVAPFKRTDLIFQMATPDGEIVYGKFGTKQYGAYPDCSLTKPLSNQAINCIVQPADGKKHRYCSKGIV